MQVKKQQNWTWNNRLVPNRERSTSRLYIVTLLMPGESHGWRNLVGYSPWGRKESDTIERLHFHFSLSCIGEGNGNPLHCSCLENPRDGEAWWAAIYGVAQERTGDSGAFGLWPHPRGSYRISSQLSAGQTEGREAEGMALGHLRDVVSEPGAAAALRPPLLRGKRSVGVFLTLII